MTLGGPGESLDPPQEALASVGALAVEWASVRRQTIDLRRARNEMRCDEVEYDVEGDYAPYGRRGDPCWQTLPETWCPPCRERQRLHEQWKAATARRTGLLRRLTNACARSGHLAEEVPVADQMPAGRPEPSTLMGDLNLPIESSKE